ncbi:TetR/AcrR family transcriptional regulator [Frankia sp. CNm7]|uniref:TetR/AcrR family transcriptional regulator n=1 Tax=Frankia nepalensis TaxID=1836974 RepID=A0A937UL94_9ACTN|nr:TetR/AcrR family transcriptional regulator [Frankia nepalensis]MBL7496336.1 TetR/AcrR family transcriptional regulator [Frankia nepalensis]MBL7508467.1 TetR/AcrR family transcriptional regulator [Frankia nepalensis]MBL7521631.1 TetR/AcrR family transcriptional regulator [Frankia nepalensis]MBL7627599.1 TetR/AcrR family transcriptional regulator [Frankia nepalensis]
MGTSGQEVRSRGSRAHETRDRIVDATIQLLAKEGYGNITTRRIGEIAGVKYQLVHYYFQSLEDLFIQAFRRGAEENLARLAEIAKGEASLHRFWKVNSSAGAGKLMVEFVALAQRHPALRLEIAAYARRFRDAQLEFARAALERESIATDQVPPMVVLLLTTGLAQLEAHDHLIGIADGHDETRTWIENWLAANTIPVKE